MSEILKVEGLSYRYADGPEAIRGVSFSIKAGERAAFIGPNGAGKSTMILAIGGFLRAEGEIRIFGEKLTPKSAPRLRGRLGIVFQEPEDQLFMPTLFDDVAFGPLNLGLPEAEVRERVKRALAQVGLAGLEQRSPHHLSGGEKKSAAIATILSMQPELIILDEPTANLDARSKKRLVGVLRALDCTLLLSSHDLDSVVQLCQRAILLDSGTLVADLSIAELRERRHILEEHGLEPPREW